MYSTKVGVGLRHEHYFDAIKHPADIDFIEVHAENFFSEGGLVKDLLRQAAQRYDVSIHATSLGLGSVNPPSATVVKQLGQLCTEFDPILVSDHACFNRAVVHGKQIHTGDLLPLRYNQDSLDILAQHVDSVQSALGRTLLIENLSAYLLSEDNSMTEMAFLRALCEKTGCKILLDLNNMLVNQYNEAVNAKVTDYRSDNKRILDDIAVLSPAMIGEIHLAGTSPVAEGQLLIDDHAQTVSETCWLLYEQVTQAVGVKPTLIEWDQSLPSWQELTALAQRAKAIQQANLL